MTTFGRRSTSRGFTLLELSVAVTLLGMLAAFGYNSYRGYAERARVQKAIADIAHISLKIAEYENRPERLGAGLPDSLAELGLDPQFLTDPWGNPYRYLKLDTLMGVGGARKDHNNVQLNRDFDLYSLGQNGETNQTFTSTLSRDDIVRGASGAYYGTPAEYAEIPSPYR